MRLLAIGFAARDLTQFDVLAAPAFRVRYPTCVSAVVVDHFAPIHLDCAGVNSCSASRGRRLPFAAVLR
jgi:hypothetical protein